ncbi:very short patch repair endonuclease [Sphingorhabdus sp. SMR4y]|uniref:very short patch repair endonuclease n=1 Tax=Sphingorhabdus sp. SMR4y TaxID=2584094 RepID=UPI000B5CE54D|nr:very short patch repair endonuclease [Sphingorhabdus sp. SMR4y]
MVDIVSPEKRSKMMAGISGKNTKPELIVRRILHSQGFRYRLHDKSLPGKPDIVLRKWNKVILVDGCFWHGHKDCAIFRLPKSRTEFWQAKIQNNIQRDQANIKLLVSEGWGIIRIWECATKGKTRISPQTMAEILKKSVTKNQAFAEVRGGPETIRT